MIELENSFLEHTSKLIGADNLKVKTFKDSRIRISFLDKINMALDVFMRNINDIKLAYIPKDKDDKPIWLKSDETGEELTGQFFPEKMLNKDQLDKYYNDINELINEKVIILEDNEKDRRLFNGMRVILEEPEELELKNNGDEYLYNLLCERFAIEI